MDVDYPALAVDVANFQLRWLGSPEAGGVQQHQDHSIADIGRGLDQLLDFFRAKDDRKLLRSSGQPHIVELRIVPLEHLLEEKSQSRHAVLDGSGRQLLVPQHVELELAELFGPQLFGRFVEVDREITDGPDVPADGSRGEVATLEFLQHALT